MMLGSVVGERCSVRMGLEDEPDTLRWLVHIRGVVTACSSGNREGLAGYHEGLAACTH
jgi:hypothetical protein